MEYCTQREITSSSWTGLIFQHNFFKKLFFQNYFFKKKNYFFSKKKHYFFFKIIFQKNTSFVFFELIFLFRNVLIILASAKNLVYDIQCL